MENYLPLRKRRELGTILSDTFAFSRNNVKQLYSVLVKTCGIPFLVVILASAYYQYVLMNPEPATVAVEIGLALLAMVLAGGIFYAISAATVYSFINEYEVNKGLVNEANVIDNAKGKFGGLILLVIVSYFMLVFGFVFFVIPGIYFLVPLGIVFPLMVLRNTSVGSSISQSFELIKGYWWVTFGTILVVVIIISLISVAFSMPAFIYLMIKTAIVVSQSSVNALGTPNDFIYLILATLGNAASYILSIIMLIALAIVYYDLDEEKNNTGIRQKIEELGS
ncbi:hypothetical protein MM213_07675 [Belliella sp. R4-6]|uniref:Glycerophosphoryl diester phosphodiesterase membrane domain-containing protein n=1 Tax=Belliella alkalica TaxID=1730871 RepID=A0ABS9VAA8_9BACT|nr:hypothetical protein [Belliella alkalica]MCH7413357.1 hypothetical protein [Belliella alkalica]